jgi:hypothetical protein
MLQKNAPEAFYCASCEIHWTPSYFEKFEGEP